MQVIPKGCLMTEMLHVNHCPRNDLKSTLLLSQFGALYYIIPK